MAEFNDFSDSTQPMGSTARHIGTTKVNHRLSSCKSKISQAFSSLGEIEEKQLSNGHGNGNAVQGKYLQRYASKSKATTEEATLLDNIKTTCTTSASSNQDGQSDRSSAHQLQPDSRRKSFCVDDFIEKVNLNKTVAQLNVSAESGEGHCSGACAFIPNDCRSLIHQAYVNSDFSSVDPSPISLPMVGDDGIIRHDSQSS